MGYLGKRNPGDIAHQPNQKNIQIGTPPNVTVGNLTVISGAVLPAFERLIVQPTGISQLGTVTVGLWQGSGIAPQYGGTGLVSYSVGDILYADGAGSITVLPSGSEGQVLTIASGEIRWV